MRSNFLVQRQPVIDKQRYRPFGLHPDFLQNSFDLIFLPLVVFYWKWGVVLIISYYLLESLLLWIFTAVRINQSLFVTQQYKRKIIGSVSIVLMIVSAGQLFACYTVCDGFSEWFPLQTVLFGEQDFAIGVGAIVLQQAMELFKYKRLLAPTAFNFWNVYATTMFRIVVQQVTILLSLCLIPLLFTSLSSKALVVALFIALIKLFAGQLQWYKSEV